MFGRRRTAPDEDPAPDPADWQDEDEDDEDEDDEELDEWARLDRSRDWRGDGPFDIEEVDLADDEVERIDLGVLIVTPDDAVTIKLIAEADQIMFLVAEDGLDSAARVSVIAAPAMQDYCAELRQELIAASQDAQSVELAPGPFGTEVRRVVSSSDPQGREVFTPRRDWLIPGPRWVLSVGLTGRIALDTGQRDSVLEEFVRNMIVRRGDQAMVPGAVIPLRAKPKTSEFQMAP